MPGLSFTIGRVAGIPIRIHWSLMAVLAVLAPLAWRAGGRQGIFLLAVLEVGAFTSYSLHELAHALVAVRQRCRVRDITLTFLGGTACLADAPKRPGAEFAMAVAGPAVSVLLGCAGWYGGARLPLDAETWPRPFLGGWSATQFNLVQLLGLVNWGLALFNLIPAFPMDGGRMLRALLTRRMGRRRATRLAVRIGRIVALAIGVFGLSRFWPAGWMLIAAAVFVASAAGREARLVALEELGRHPDVPPWWPFGPPRPRPPVGEVSISPPPYAQGPDTKTDLHGDNAS